MRIEPKVAKPTNDVVRTGASTASEKPPTEITLGNFLLSQSGNLMPAGYGTKSPVPLVAPNGRAFTRIEITALDEAGVHRKRTVELDERGVAKPNPYDLLGTSSPFQLTLLDADGNRWSAVVDITPRKLGVSHSGFEEMKGVKLAKEAPPPPAEVTLGDFLLSQSGMVMPQGYGTKNPVPLVSPDGHAFERLEVTALDQSRVHRTRTVELDDRGVPRPNANNLLGTSSPLQLTLVDAQGNRWSGVVDISPSKIGVSHQGYEEMKGIQLKRVRDEQPGNDAALGGVAGDFVKSQSAPKTGKSLFDHMLKR